MKLILSRKGFDSAHGGCPSPILDEGLCSLPIPDSKSRIPYEEISWRNGISVSQLVEDLTRGRIKRGDGAHLDPDLRRDAIARAAGWRPIFGQADKAQSHLANQGVGRGDLFLFFGCFQRAERVDSRFYFVRCAPRLHVMFGWLQIGEIVPVTGDVRAKIPWVASTFPHLTEPERYRNDTIYVASERLSSIGLDASGAGTFERFTPQLVLSQTGARGRSTWQLPQWFMPEDRPPLSYHSDKSRWTKLEKSVELRTVGRGQEFVLDVDQYPEARAWIRSIFRAAKR